MIESKPVPLARYVVVYFIAGVVVVSSSIVLRSAFHSPALIRYSFALLIFVLAGYLVARNEPKRSTFYLVLSGLLISFVLNAALYFIIEANA